MNAITAGPFNEMLSDAYSVPLKTIVIYTRTLKQAGLMTTGARGVNAPNMTPLDAARVTIAVLGSHQPTKAAEMVRRFQGLPFRPDLSWGKLANAQHFLTLEGAIEFLFSCEDKEQLLEPPWAVSLHVSCGKAGIEGGDACLVFTERNRITSGLRIINIASSASLMKVRWFFRNVAVAP